MAHYFIDEKKYGGKWVEGAVFTTRELTEKELTEMYRIVFMAIKTFDEMDPFKRYDLKIDKATLITYYLQHNGFKNAKYEYLG
jgi:hypothetical protein